MKIYLFTLLWMISALSCSDSKKTFSSTPVHSAKDSLTTELQQLYELRYFNGFSVSIVNENGTLYENGFGYSDIKNNKKYTEKTIQNIASISKTLVGIALLKAQELGKLNLDDPIEKYLPFDVFNPNFSDQKITIRQLATHTSSIIDNEFYLSKNYFLYPHQNLKGVKLMFEEMQIFNPADSVIPLSSFLENLLSKQGKWNTGSYTQYCPGKIYEYSNTGTTLAAFTIEQATQMSFHEFVKQYILEPLEMNQSGWRIKDIQLSDYSRLYENPKSVLPFYEMITYPDGGFITSAHDLGIFLSELMKGYYGNGKILSPESYSEYYKQQLSAQNFIERNERNPSSDSYNTGIFIGFGYTGYIGHTGGDPGVSSMMFFHPKTQTGRIFITNTNFTDKGGNDTFYKIWDTLKKYQSSLN